MRNTIILLILALALGAYVWFYEIEGEQERKAQQEMEEKLVAIPKDSIQTVIINDFDKTFRFEKENDGWEITEPVKTGADQSAVTSLLSSLTSTKKSRPFSVSLKEKVQFGLNDVLLRLKVIGINGSADSVQLGQKTSIGEEMYVSKGNQDTVVAVSPISLKNAAQKSLFSWRDKKTVHFNKDQVRSFNLITRKNTFSFTKEGSDWKITKPLEAAAENSTVNAVLSKLDYGQIKSVEAESATNLSKYKLSKPDYKIELFSGPEQAKSTVIFSEDEKNKYFGKDEVRPHIFTVDSTFIQPLKKDMFAFRDKDLVDFNKASIDRINLLNGKELLMFTKDSSDQWHISTGEPVKSYKIKDLVNAVADMKIDAFISEKPAYLMPYELANPKKKLELYAGDSKEVELEFGKVKGDKMYVRVSQTGQVVAITTKKLEKILLTMDDVYDKTAKNVNNTTK